MVPHMSRIVYMSQTVRWVAKCRMFINNDVIRWLELFRRIRRLLGVPMVLVDKSVARVTDDVIPRFLFLVTHELAVFVGGLTLSYMVTSPLLVSILGKLVPRIESSNFGAYIKATSACKGTN